VIPESLVHLGIPLAVVIAVIAWLLMEKTTAGYAVKVVGLAPRRAPWRLQRRQGHLGDAAGGRRACGTGRPVRGGRPLRPAHPAIPDGLRLHRDHRRVSRPAEPARHRLRRHRAGGDLCRRRDRADDGALPQAATGMFQALLLFMLLATDVLVRYERIGWKARAPRSHDSRPSSSRS
jgi:hypothetical protein